jgi:hypothetical protein
MTHTIKTTNQLTIKKLENTVQKSWKICSLDRALEYQNDDIVYRFTSLWDVSFAEAQDLFIETKKWLWLCAQPEKERLAITSPLLIIDEMWHNFILFSYDYMEYCQNYFGRYLHHAPTSYQEKEEYKKQYEIDPDDAAEKNLQEQIKQFGLIYQKLGIETLLKWYVEYPERYNEEFFKQSYKPMEMNWTPSPEMQKIVSLFKAGKLVIRN